MKAVPKRKRTSGMVVPIALVVLVVGVIAVWPKLKPILFMQAQTTQSGTPTQTITIKNNNLQQPPTPPEGTMGFYYAKLSANEKIAYTNIRAALPNFPHGISIPLLNPDSASSVFHALLFDNPELFQLSSKSGTSTLDNEMTFLPEYAMPQTEYIQKKAQLEQAADALFARLPQGANDYETELFLHDALIRTCVYSATGNPSESTAYGALVQGKASCEGYAKAMLYLFDKAGIPCYLMTGNATNAAGKTEGHAWNYVQIGGEWYQLDATWDDPVSPLSNDEGKDPSHVYFNLTDEEMFLSHNAAEEADTCTATQANYFVQAGLLFSEFSSTQESLLAQEFADAANSGSSQVELRFASPTEYDNAFDRLINNERVYRILSNANLQAHRKIATRRIYFIEYKNMQILRLVMEVTDS